MIASVLGFVDSAGRTAALMSPTKAALTSLQASLQQDLKHGESHLDGLAAWRNRQPVGHEIAAAAVLLHHLHSAIEAVLERSLKTLTWSCLMQPIALTC